MAGVNKCRQTALVWPAFPIPSSGFLARSCVKKVDMTLDLEDPGNPQVDEQARQWGSPCPILIPFLRGMGSHQSFRRTSIFQSLGVAITLEPKEQRAFVVSPDQPRSVPHTTIIEARFVAYHPKSTSVYNRACEQICPAFPPSRDVTGK